MNKYLDAKEKRALHVTQAFEHAQTVIQIRANIPGHDKKIKEAYIICQVFFHIINDLYTIKSYEFIDYDDGPTYVISFSDENPDMLKRSLIDIEDTHPLGRFVDLDVITNDLLLSRRDFGLSNRKCYLCNDDAHVCARSQKHDVQLLVNYLKEHVQSYLSQTIHQMILQAMQDELHLEYKFGCVTKTSSGSHPDMNYALMIKAMNAITPYLVQIFELGYQNATLSKDTFLTARKIGIEAEKAMLQATNNINAYKGLIFILGSVLLSIGRDLNDLTSSSTVFQNIKMIGTYVFDDFNDHYETFGFNAFKAHHFLGARGEIIHGLSTIQKALEVFPIEKEIDESILRKILIFIIIQTDDSVLLKRSGNMDNYLHFKKELMNLDADDLHAVQLLNQKAIEQDLSVGGSADLLVTYLLIKNYYIHFYKK